MDGEKTRSVMISQLESDSACTINEMIDIEQPTVHADTAVFFSGYR